MCLSLKKIGDVGSYTAKLADVATTPTKTTHKTNLRMKFTPLRVLTAEGCILSSFGHDNRIK
jgi:hypothetical protein